MQPSIFTVCGNRALTPGVFELTLQGNASLIARPGQFVNISVPGFFLRRPISVCDWTEGSLTLLVRTVGGGTAWLEKVRAEQTLDVLLPLGNGFDIAASPANAPIVLAGGGIGVAPLYGLARALRAAGRDCLVALGFRMASDVFYADRFEALGCDVAIATEDGSRGTRGFVTSLPLPDGAYVFACGPMPMLRALAALPGLAGGQISLEARMGCGFGACMGCTIETQNGPARICHDGPVFEMGSAKL